MSTKQNPGRFGDMYSAALPDEPIFVLMARDPSAPDAVRHWALNAHKAGHDPDKIMEALAVAAAMDKWRLANANRPELIPPVVAADD